MQILTVIQQGDAYSVPIVINNGDLQVTDENTAKVRINLCGFTAQYPDGGLVYDEGYWYFPLTEEMTYKMRGGEHDLQVQISPNGINVYSSKIYKVEVGESVFKGVWLQSE